MATKFSKSAIRELMTNWGRKGGSRATDAQKYAALENMKKTPNYQKHLKLVNSQVGNDQPGISTERTK